LSSINELISKRYFQRSLLTDLSRLWSKTMLESSFQS